MSLSSFDDLVNAMLVLTHAGEHLPGEHDQSTHGNRNGNTGNVSVDKSTHDMEEIKNYSSGKDRGADSAPNGLESDWTPDKGGVVFHGTATAFTEFDTPEAYLIDDYSEARSYAKGQHLGGRGRTPMVRTIRAKPGKTVDVNNRIDDAVSSGDDIDNALSLAFKDARKAGARYVVYNHPSFSDDPNKQQRVVVSLYPKEDLKFTGGWKLKP